MPDEQRKRQSRRRHAAQGHRTPPAPDTHAPGRRSAHRGGGGANRPTHPRLNKLRFALIACALLTLALISTVFGMMTAVTQDLPSLEARNEFKHANNSALLDAHGRRLATLTGKENRILVDSEDISPTVKHAVIAVEDQRFYSHRGIDYRGIARALWADVRQRRAVQGASTITQQFVKNALLAQANRSLFQKLRESALAYQLERKWSKDKILTQYLNSVYFGEGAYGVESAARVYFGWNHPDCEPKCASVLQPAEAALLGGMIASPTTYSPVQNPTAAFERRNLVLDRMRENDLLTASEHADARTQALPPRDQVKSPRKISKSPYFTSWMEQQLIDRYGTGTAFGGGLKVRTSIDLDFQEAAEQAIARRLAGIGPSAALVALDNKTAGVRAMVGGSDFDQRPFNLATQGHRQPGSAFKPFTLVAALEEGISPGRVFPSHKKVLNGPGGKFEVNNYEDTYSGAISLAGATTVSDNSVFAEVGYKLVGTEKVADTARDMGIRTSLSTNPAMVLGGLRQGVTLLELAHSYVTLAHGGNRVSGSLAAYDKGPLAYTKVEGSGIKDENETKTERVMSSGVAKQTTQILQTVVANGTGTHARTGEFAAGKTGTTEDFLDAWFVGFSDAMTVAIWVGYPKGGKPMETEYGGSPVAGGTHPADIWRDFMMSVEEIRDARAEDREPEEEQELAPGPAPADEPGKGSDGRERDGGGDKPSKRKRTPDSTGGTEQGEPAPEEPETPEPEPAPAEPPAEEPPSDGGTGVDGAGMGRAPP